jgi:hypothetical protein
VLDKKVRGRKANSPFGVDRASLLIDAQLAKSRAQTETKAAQAETKANVIVMPRCSALILYWSGDSVLPRLRERS